MMTRWSRAPLAALAVAPFLASLPANAHNDGTEEFPCDEGPFAVPGLLDPPDQIGQWSTTTSWPEQATHVIVLHTGKVLWWRGNSSPSTPATTYVWDPATEQLTTELTAEDNIFCAGFTTLSDGRALVLGGSVIPDNDGLPDTNIFDPASETWTFANLATYARWYPTVTMLADGRVLGLSGIIQQDPLIRATIPEIWDPATGLWSELPGAPLSEPPYTQAFHLTDGRVLVPGMSGITRALNVATETWETISSGPNLTDSTAAMYEPDKIVRIGGGFLGLTGTADVEILDMSQPNPAWQSVSQMAYPRLRPDLVIMPDGHLVAIGGSIEGLSSPECAMHAAEAYDPVTDQWTTWASMAKPRIYHATAALLPDGRVLVAGGENSHTAGGEQNYEIFSPPYLFQGPRPQITNAPLSAAHGTVFQVSTPDAPSIAKVALIRPSAVTHNFDQNQRYVPLSFTQGAGVLEVTAPLDGNVAPPGFYMLFVLDAAGIPSEAHFIRLTSALGVPLIGAPMSGVLGVALVAAGGLALWNRRAARRGAISGA